mmetsp:Transcript_1327/g.1684  ORF Transcript_1327/g.1684 Transcript_1327/m.1684 type:complete len:165 (+) Transcript_1327:169-663(+)
MSYIQLKTLSLKAADDIASRCVQIALKNAFNPVAICVMDSGGAPIVTKRMDNCPPMAYPQISEAKANTCLAMKSSSREYGKKYLSKEGTPDVFVRLLNQVSIVDGNVAGFPGGVLIRDKESQQIMGAVGVSGAAGAEDEYIALTAVQQSCVGEDVVTEPMNPSI